MAQPKPSFRKKRWKWVGGNPNRGCGGPVRLLCLKPPADPWTLLLVAQAPERSLEGLHRGCMPPLRWAGGTRLAPLAPALPDPIPPALCPALGAVPRSLPQAPSGPPPPAARGARRCCQESYRVPVQGRAATTACAKLRFPHAALAACRPPCRPRGSLRSPCRQGAISDRRLRNLPKCAGPEMAEAGRSRAARRGRGGALETFRQPRKVGGGLGSPAGWPRSHSRGAAGGCGKRGAGGAGEGLRAQPAGQRPGRPL